MTVKAESLLPGYTVMEMLETSYEFTTEGIKPRIVLGPFTQTSDPEHRLVGLADENNIPHPNYDLVLINGLPPGKGGNVDNAYLAPEQELRKNGIKFTST